MIVLEKSHKNLSGYIKFVFRKTLEFNKKKSFLVKNYEFRYLRMSEANEVSIRSHIWVALTTIKQL